MLRHQPSHSPLSARLLVRRRYEHHVPRQLFTGIAKGALEQQHCHQIDREHSLVVDGATPVQVPVADLAAERIEGPARSIDADDVHVSEQNHWTTRAVAANAADDL